MLGVFSIVLQAGGCMLGVITILKELVGSLQLVG